MRIDLYGGKGYVEFLYSGGTEEDIIKAARMSTNKGFQGWDRDLKLLSYLWNNRHFTPFEFCQIAIEIKAPIYVARQVFRHRTFSYNEQSGRYSELPEEAYIPELKFQSQTNKQGSGSLVSAQSKIVAFGFSVLDTALHKLQWFTYKALLAAGVSKEQARMRLPVSTMTKWRMTGNLRNWIHFLGLRMDTHAQEETRELAKAIFEILSAQYPRSLQLFTETTPFNIKLPNPGLLMSTIHGYARRNKVDPLHSIWRAIIQRCTNPKDPRFSTYGARGIGICDRWLDFSKFIQDIPPRPDGKGKRGRSLYSIDRIDNDKGYEPGNIKWSTAKEQGRNTTRNRMITANGETLCLKDWADRLGISHCAIIRRIKEGMTEEDAVTTKRIK